MVAPGTLQIRLESYEYFNPFLQEFEKGIFLLEYEDVFIKDALISQLSEQWKVNDRETLFVQELSPLYSLTDMVTCRKLFKKCHYSYPTLYQLQQTYDTLKLEPYFSPLEVITPQSKHPKDFLEQMFHAINQNISIKYLVIDSDPKYLDLYNFYPQLSSLAFQRDITILFTSQVSKAGSYENKPSTYLKNLFKSVYYLQSTHLNLISLCNTKDIICDFVIEDKSKLGNAFHFTIRPSVAYIQEG